MTVYVLNRFWLKHLGIPFFCYFLKNYLNDYIGGVVFCIYVNLILFFSGRNPIYRLHMLFMIMLGVSLLWEFVFPTFLSYSTSDKYDVLAYMLGTTTYYFLMKKQNDLIVKERKPKSTDDPQY